MSVLFATLGFTSKLALAPLRDHDYEAVHIFFGLPLKAEGKEALAGARMTCETLGVKLVEHGVEDAFDYEAVLEALSRQAASVDEDIHVNGSGGTRPMVMASTIFAFTNDLPLLYYDEYETHEGKIIPLKAYSRLPKLGQSQRAILERLRSGSADMGTLAADLDLAPSTLSVHVKRMSESGLVSVLREGKRKLVTAAPEILRVGASRPAKRPPPRKAKGPGMGPADALLAMHRDRILELCREHGVENVWLFGSVARGQAGEASDLDLLIEPGPRFTLFAHGALIEELEGLLGVDVDVVTKSSLHPVYRDEVLKEARPL